MKIPKITGKRGQGVLDNVQTLVIGGAALAVALVVVFLLMANLAANSEVVADANATAAVQTLQSALQDNVVGFVGIIFLVAIAGVLIFLVRRGLQS